MIDKKIDEVLILPDIRTVKPDKLEAANSVIVNRCFDKRYSKELFDGTQWVLNPKAKGKYRMTLKNVRFFSFDTDTNKEKPVTLNFFDYAVFNAICTLMRSQYLNGQEKYVMTNRMIAEVLTGIPIHNGQKRKSELLQDISISISRMRSTLVAFDWSEQAEIMNREHKFAHGDIADTNNCTVDEEMIRYRRETKKINGQIVECYEFTTVPNLYRYSMTVSQMLSFDKAVLAVPRIANNVKSISLKLCMVKRVELLKNKRNAVSSRAIKYDYVCSQCGFDKEDKRERQTRKEQMTKTCNYWKEIGYISDYSVKQEKNKFSGIEIII